MKKESKKFKIYLSNKYSMSTKVVLAKNMIEKAKKIAIFGHMSPDGDCIGSML